MNWDEIISLLETVCLLFLACQVSILYKAKNAAGGKIEALEKECENLSDTLTDFGTALGRETASMKDRLSELEAANEDYHAFDDKLMTGLQGLLDYNMESAAGGGK